ncbi:putative NLE (NUC135) domain containing protein [Lyophyllum shimeji]|uniref:Ribosome biogenesis protein YTM1 n=1 Tax=Lyophyllum shimeji TaxID=47721 RepID=A0A9P3Q0R3_LYOSH|nr:putative NLE (NUC135) domain containing protein [Lyophyllum shimeji]
MASTSSTVSLPVVFTTQTAYPLPTQKFMIPATWKRYQLSQLVNKALSLPQIVPFDFLVKGEILRTTLGEWCAEHGVGEEETLEIEYIESVMPPEKVSDFPHEDWVSSVSCKLHGQFFTASYDGHIRSFDYTKNATSSTHAHSAPITSICLVPTPSADPTSNTHTIASASHDLTAQLTQITLKSPETPSPPIATPLATLHLHTAPVASIACDGAGTHLVTASWDGLVGLWDTSIPETDEVPQHEPSERERKKRRRVDEERKKAPRKAPVSVLKSHIGRVSRALFALDENTKAYSCGFDSTVRVWDTETGVCVHAVTASEKPFLDLAFPQDRDTILASSTDRTMTLYDLRIPTPVMPANAPLSFMHPATPSCLAASSTSQQVVSGAYDGVARLWDLRSTKDAVASFRAWEGAGKILSVDWERGMVGVGGEGGFGVWKVGEGTR